MTVSATEPKEWTPRRRWIFTGMIFAAQIWAIYHFRVRATPLAAPAGDETIWRFFAGSLNSEEIATNLLGDDPTLFALPNFHGFSGPIWLATTCADTRPAVWDEPARYLPLDAGSLGRTLSIYLQDHSFPPFEAFNADTPSSESLGLYVPPEAPETNSLLVLSGELAGRGLENPPSLPAWPAADLITNSTIRLSVNAAGTVLSAALIGQSGQADADTAALELARKLRFRPSSKDFPLLRTDGGALSSGDAVFWWAMLAATNAAPSKSIQSP